MAEAIGRPGNESAPGVAIRSTFLREALEGCSESESGWGITGDEEEMNLQSVLTVLAGGPGSGCTGPNCGRPKGDLQKTLEQFKEKFGSSNNLWSKLAEYGHPGNTEPFTAQEIRQLEEMKRAAGFSKRSGDCKVGFCFMNAQRLAIVADTRRDNRVQLVEGLVTVHGVPIDHSWIEYNGKVYDPTLATYKARQPGDYTKGGGREKWSDDMEQPEYFGVTVPKEDVIQHQLKTEHYDPLSHDWRDEKLQGKIWKK